MATTEAAPEIDAHGDHGHDHDHPAFLAHHFDTPEQQFDSGKLGIWLFLVTEVLFFSGMFCAYAIFRAANPEVFQGCSQFLNTKLGAINTGVLLFSSLSMALAVRCSQVEDHKGLVAMLATTLSCAMIFLGVKAIEYSHKWTMGLLPAGLFTYDQANPHPAGGPNYLAWLCFPFAVALIGVLIWLTVSIANGNKFQAAVAKPLSVVCLSFFIGVGLGVILESGGSEGHASAAEHHSTADHSGDHNAARGADHDAGEHADAISERETVEVANTSEVNSDDQLSERLAQDATNTGLQDALMAQAKQAELASGSVVGDPEEVTGAITGVPVQVYTPSRAGVFFSIYYCMTGVHAIHILGGIVVLTWLLFRAVRNDFNRQYFGPVDYVGLYWHLVDLIWIYLFPLMYLIR